MRFRLLAALIVLVALVLLVSAGLTYRRVLSESSSLLDYQLRQLALSLRGQIALTPNIEVPGDRADTDIVIQVWDLFGKRVWASRNGLPVSNQIVLGYADFASHGEIWRAFGLQTAAGIIQVAQPARVRADLARAAALRVVYPLMLLLPIMIAAVMWIVQQNLSSLRLVAADVQRRDAHSLAPLNTSALPLELEPLVNELNRLLQRLSAAFAAQRDFIADAAHELRSPLTSLRLQLQLLDRASDQAAQHDARRMLGAGVERAIHLVEQLLTMARFEPQTPAAELLPVVLTDIARQGIGDCHWLALQREIDLGLDGEQVQVLGDAEALRIMVRNIVDNALRYSPLGGSVQVSCMREPPAAVVFQVDDSGPGIPAADRQRAVDRFFRLHETQESGTGLGLAIVQAIAERHHARVILLDAPAGGLRVRVVFPQRLALRLA